MKRSLPDGESSRPWLATPVILLGLYILALLTRAVIQSRGLGLFEPDERDFLSIAHMIRETGRFSAGPEALWPAWFRAPILPYVLAGMQGLGLEDGSMRWVLAAFASLCPVAVFLLTHALTHSRPLALAAGLVAVFHPLHSRIAFDLTTDASSAVLFCLGVYLFVREFETRRQSTALLAGLAFGLAASMRSNILIFELPLYACWLGIALMERRRDAWRRLVFACLGMVAIVGPLASLRSFQEGRPLLLTDAGSEIFWRGNSRFTYDYMADGNGARYIPYYLEAVGGTMMDPNAGSKTWRASFDFIREDPLRWVGLKFRLLFETWRPWPSFVSDDVVGRMSPGKARAVAVVKTMWFLLVDGFLILVLVNARRAMRNPVTAALLGVLAAGTAFGTLFFPDPRYRLPVDMILVAMAAWSVRAWRLERLQHGRA